MPTDTVTVEPVQCKTCGSSLTVHVDRWDADANHRQTYQCPVCAKCHDGRFMGRIVRVTRQPG
jgi:hypothetical protein